MFIIIILLVLGPSFFFATRRWLLGSINAFVVALFIICFMLSIAYKMQEPPILLLILFHTSLYANAGLLLTSIVLLIRDTYYSGHIFKLRRFLLNIGISIVSIILLYYIIVAIG